MKWYILCHNLSEIQICEKGIVLEVHQLKQNTNFKPIVCLKGHDSPASFFLLFSRVYCNAKTFIIKYSKSQCCFFLRTCTAVTCSQTVVHRLTQQGALQSVSWNQSPALNQLGFHPGFDFTSNNFTFISHILCSTGFVSVLKSSRSDAALDNITRQGPTHTLVMVYLIGTDTSHVDCTTIQ